jgi:hypothetical protein
MGVVIKLEAVVEVVLVAILRSTERGERAEVGTGTNPDGDHKPRSRPSRAVAPGCAADRRLVLRSSGGERSHRDAYRVFS